MQTVLISVTVFISILLVIVVLIQKSKGGGLASNFAGSNQIMGVRRTTDFIEKATWTFAAIVGFLSLLSGILMVGNRAENQPMVKDVAPIEQPAMPFETPAAAAATEEAEEAAQAVEDAEAVAATEASTAAAAATIAN